MDSGRHNFGLQKEKELKERIQSLVGETLNDSEKRFALFDWTTDNYLVELKSRRAQYSHEDFDEWVLPCCKADLPSEKKKVFFYYWEQGNRLFRLDYNPESFATFKRARPFWTSQEHYFVPADQFVEIDEPGTKN